MADLPVPGTQLTAATPEATIRAGIPEPVRDLLVDALGGRARRVRRRGLASRPGARPAGRGLGPGIERAARAGPRAPSRTPCTRTSSGPSRSAAAARSSRSRPSARTTTTPTSAGRTGSSSATPSSSISPAATSPATRWRGAPAPRPPMHPDSSIRTTVPRTSRLAGLRAVGDPLRRFEEDALRMVRAVRLAATLDFEVEPATLAGIEARAELVGHLSGERIATELDKLLGRRTPVGRAAAAGRHGAAGGHLARARVAARHPAEQGAGRGPVGSHAADRRCRSGRAAGRPARRARPRHRQAGDVRRRPLHRPRHGRGGPGRGVPGAAAVAEVRSRAHRPPRPQPHVQLRVELVATRPSAGSSRR